jgi:homoserine acetyltransferase
MKSVSITRQTTSGLSSYDVQCTAGGRLNMRPLSAEIKHYHHGRFTLAAGGILPDAVTTYQTYGDPMNPCIVFPTCYGAKLAVGSKSKE